jgi:O-succinylbenzoic acid--CoA ligase
MLDLLNTTVDKFTALGIKAGDRVAIHSDNCPEFAIAVVALWKIGAVAIPISTRLPMASVNELMLDINASRILDSEKLKEIVSCDKTILNFPAFDSLSLDLNADASILFTSASSGNAKAVLHTIGNHYYSALGSHENIAFTAGDCWLMSLPMYHISGFSLLMRALAGAASIYFTDDPLQKAIMRSEITHISVVPTQFQRMINAGQSESFQNFKAILLGGAAIAQSLLKASKKLNLPVHTTYGLTELASQVVTDSKVLPYRELKTAADGEILVKGRTLFKGYASGGGLDLPVDKDGYFATGDIGCFDDNGNLQITGRKDLMFISGGENVYPEEIERLLCGIENIEQAVVVPVDDPEFGKRPAAFIQIASGGAYDIEKIKNQFAEKIESFKVPVAFYTMPEGQLKALKPGRGGLAALAKEYYSKNKGQ